MVLNSEQTAHIFRVPQADSDDELRNGLIAEKYRWKNKTIPYALSNSFTAEQKVYIEKGLRNLEAVSCLKFVPRKSENDYIEVLVNKMKKLMCLNDYG